MNDRGCGLVRSICDRARCRCFRFRSRARRRLPGGFVFLRDIDPSIIQDIRYAGINNFVGRPLSGYEAAECVVKREVGLALKRVQRELAPQKLSLKMLDCYRPARAVHDMVVWAQNGRETPAERRYQSGVQQEGSVSSGLYRRAFRPFHRRRPRPDAGRSDGRQFGGVRSRQGLCRLHRAGGGPRPGRQRRHGHRLRLFRPQGAHRRQLHHAGPAPLAQGAGCGHGEARFCELFQGVVAFFAAGRGRARV